MKIEGLFLVVYKNLSSALRHLQTRPMDNKIAIVFQFFAFSPKHQSILQKFPGFLFEIKLDIHLFDTELDIICSSLKKSRFFKHFCFCAPCLTVGAVPLLKLSRSRESANVQVLYFVGSVQKCGTKFSTCCAYWCQKKKKKQFFLVSRQLLSLKKKKRKTKNLFNSPVCVLEISDLLLPFILQGTHNNNSVVIQFYHFPNHVSCQIPSEKRLKCLLLRK